ncbi:MAG: MMPL family transporter, partial [Halobacteriovoraceae bacterium]|nr:MMPL family transporter [Halobacteriovoraceae bacterium]
FSLLNDYILETYVTSISIALLLITVIFVFIFRSFKIGLLSLIPNLLPLVYGAGVLSIFNIFVDTGCVIVISTTFGIVVDDTVYFFSHYYDQRKDGRSIKQSLSYIFHGVASSLTITTVILISCFAFFGFSNLVPNRNFGLISSLILFFALICDLVFAPAVLLFFKEKKNEKKNLSWR